MAEGSGSWRDFTRARGDSEVARGAVATCLLGAADAESTGQAQCSGLRAMNPAWEVRGAVVVSEVEEQFLHLAIRKQVSY
ncbi:hypothetical protein M959_11675, partial [Chaetura pelagica]